MPWGINNVDAVVFELLAHAFPKTGSRRRSDGDTAFLFLFHPIHCGCTIVHLTDFMGPAGVKQHALSSRGFTRVYMSNDTDVPVPIYWSLTSHDSSLYSLRSA
jgi:hypothetical protein